MFRWSSSGQFKQPSGSILWMAPEGNFIWKAWKITVYLRFVGGNAMT